MAGSFAPSALLLITALFPLLLQGCFVRTSAGHGWSEEHTAILVNAHADIGLLGAGVRSRWATDLQEVGLAVEAGFPGIEDPFFYAYGGVNVLQAGLVNQEFRFGAGSPWAELGLGWCQGSWRDGLCYSVGLDAEYTLRLFPFETEAFLGVTFGVTLYQMPRFGH